MPRLEKEPRHRYLRGGGLQLLSRRNGQALSKPLPARLSEGDKGIIGMKSSRFVYEMTSKSPKGAICKKKPLVPD
jgi:hypothetical protein